MKKSIIFVGIFVIIVLLPVFSMIPCQAKASPGSGLNFELSFPAEIHPAPITGRVYVIISKTDRREPRLQISTYGMPFFGKNIEKLKPGGAVVIDEHVMGYPVESLSQIPPGDYFVQGMVNIYTEFKRSDGHTIWLHNDQWEGQRWNRSPGNLFSDVQQVSIGSAEKNTIKLICKNIISPIEIPPDTKWVKRIKFQSKILTKFWGQPIYLGATVLLPKGYDDHPDVFYPVNYIQGHFSLRAPNGFSEKPSDENNRWARRAREFSQFWMSDSCPRMFAVTFQHPCPYYDDSYAINSANVGPYGDAIITELIPYLEEHFQMIRQPYARILSGGSTGGWESLALQIFYPDFFGGTFSLCPDPVDFHYFQCVDIYEDNNAYFKEFGWLKVPTPSDRGTDGIVRLTYQQRNRYELVRGTKNRSGEQIDIFEAVYGPVGDDGYVKPLFDKVTGEIDSAVAEYWKRYDLRYYLEQNWERIGTRLVGKLHIYTGDMDSFYLNNAVKLLERYLESTRDPYYAGEVNYGDGQPHCWGPSRVELVRLIAEQVAKNAPEGK